MELLGELSRTEKIEGSAISFLPPRSLFRNFLRDRNVASICGSSHYAVQAVCNQIDFSTANRIVEFGPGTGALTFPLLARMKGNARLIAFETNLSLANSLARTVTDPRLNVFNDSAEYIDGVCSKPGCRADVVISGIPFSLMNPDTVETIISKTMSAVSPGGRFIIYQAWLPPLFSTKSLQRRLRNYFTIKSVGRVLLNFPPLEIITCLRSVS